MPDKWVLFFLTCLLVLFAAFSITQQRLEASQQVNSTNMSQELQQTMATYTDILKRFTIDYPRNWTLLPVPKSFQEINAAFVNPVDKGVSISVTMIPSESENISDYEMEIKARSSIENLKTT